MKNSCGFCTRPDNTPNIEGFEPIKETPGRLGSFGTQCAYTYYQCGACGGYWKKTVMSSSPALGGAVLSENIEFVGWKLK